METAFTAFQADDAAPRLISVWPRLPMRIKRLMVGLMAEIAEAK
jgi:hypothetical protein